MFFVVKRATLLIPSGPPSDPNRKHLFICLTDPAGVAKETLMVSVSTLRDGFPVDETCRLFEGDHSFIKRNSYVDYRSARIIAAEKLVKGVNQGQLIAMDALESSVFARVCYGLMQSPHTAPKLLAFYLAATGND